MSREAAEPSVADLPGDWFQRAQRALEDLQFRTERTRRELSVREHELEMRSRDLAARGDQLREAFRTAEETSQDLMARTHALREEEVAIAREREAVYKEREEIARLHAELEARRAEFAAKEAMFADLERRLREREDAVARAQLEIETLRNEQHVALAAARDALGGERALAAESRTVPEEERTHVSRLLELEAAMEAAHAHAHSIEGDAERLLREATARAATVHSIEERIREQETRLAAMRLEIVNAKQALLAVDRALTQMPYEVVDDFTRSDAFDAYERAVRALRRFEENPPA